jgi:hypothetical protein
VRSNYKQIREENTPPASSWPVGTESDKKTLRVGLLMEQHRKRYKDHFAVPLSICAFSINIKPYKWSHLSDVVTTSPHTSSLEA